MRVVAGLVVAVVSGACGDNETIPAEVCEPPQGELPTTGPFIDPYDAALEMPEGCVEGGLRDLPGRWFLNVPNQYFFFEYPKYEGSCTSGFRRFGGAPDDYDDTDDNMLTRHTWSDGTRYFERARAVYQFGPAQTYEIVRGTVSCMLADGTLAVRYIRYNSEDGPMIYGATGTRFAPKEETSTELEFVGELGRKVGGKDIFGLNLIVEGDVGYMVGTEGFDTIDLTNRAQPAQLGHVDGYLNDVRIVHGNGKTVAFAASEGGDDRVWIIDATDPANPDFSSVIDEYAHSVQIQTVGATTSLYLANYSETIPRFDVTNPLSPVKTGTAVLPGETVTGIHDLTVYGDRIYANNTDVGVVAIDTSASYDSPTELARTPSAYSHASWAANINGREIVLHGDEGMTASADGGAFLRVLDGDPASPTFLEEIGRYQTRKEVGIHNIEVHGTRAYIAYYQDGVRVVELADPTNPVEVAHYNTWQEDSAYGSSFEGAVGVRKVGDYIYVADLARGLIVLRDAP